MRPGLAMTAAANSPALADAGADFLTLHNEGEHAMFARFRIWLAGASGLRDATRDAVREATREGLTEGFRLGVGDFLDRITGPAAVDVEARNTGTGHAANGQQVRVNGHKPPGTGTDDRIVIDPPKPIPAAELRGKRKPELLTLAEQRGIETDDSWTVPELREALTAEPSAK